VSGVSQDELAASVLSASEYSRVSTARCENTAVLNPEGEDTEQVIATDRHSGGRTMTAQIKLALTLAGGFVICCIGFGALHAQPNAPAAYWVTATLEVSDQAALLKAITAVPATIQAFGGHYIALGGKIAPGEGSPPRRITIVAFDGMEKAQQWFDSTAAVAARTEAQKFAKIRSYFVEGVAN
jgi:uncharacterized protein (DUF1330 family)